MGPEPLCVYCRQRSIEPKWRPFCSERCKMADLGRWLKGDYRVPSPASDADLPDDDPVVDEAGDTER
jgi:endogenous inhibitor of DNA gyrase (YacG/DUF329 family)